MAYLMQRLSEFKTPRDIAPHLVNALACAHISIIHDKEEVRHNPRDSNFARLTRRSPLF